MENGGGRSSNVATWRASRAPHPSLSGFVSGYEAYCDRTSGIRLREHLPSLDVTLIINLESPLRVRDSAGNWSSIPSGGGFLAGLHTVPASTEVKGLERGVEVALTPYGAHLLLGGLPMTALSDRVVSLEELLGRDALMLSEGLESRPAGGDLFDFLDSFLGSRMASKNVSPEFSFAWSRLSRAHGMVRIRELARDLGWSEKRLVGEFRRVTGHRPKTVARLFRFCRASELARTRASWADIAATCGYHDQAHLSHDFASFAGGPPTSLRRRLSSSSARIGTD